MKRDLFNLDVKHWSSETLRPALVIGWFSWWIWIRFVIDFYCGAWGVWITEPLWYFNPEYPVLFGSIPDMLFWITVVALVIAIPVVVLGPKNSWQAKFMTILAHVVIMFSVVYTVMVQQQESVSAEGTRLYIHLLEEKGDQLEMYEERYLEMAREIYSRYEENNPGRIW